MGKIGRQTAESASARGGTYMLIPLGSPSNTKRARQPDTGVGTRMSPEIWRCQSPGLSLSLGLVATLICGAPSQAQSSSPAPHPDSVAKAEADPSGNLCLGFRFAPWNPALDWGAAGHEPLDSTRVPTAPTGRRWALPAGGENAAADSTLLLVPPWWPAGIVVTVPARGMAMGDTVTGLATALVADGRLKAPTARVWAWRVNCR